MSIFKRLFRDRDETNNNSVPVFRPHNATIKTLGSNLQKRFSRGVQYNMKILIRGDRNVGKSALLNRLKGQDFVDQYIPTEEIEVACVQWTYKCTEDVVKVEVWDVVDKGRKRVVTGLKLENNGGIEESPANLCLDAEFLDVYKGANGVILVLDMTKSWTYSYVERELSKLPEDLPVLVLANHRDMGHHRTVNADQVIALLEPLPGYGKGIIKYWEASMKNGYGLVYIHRFFNIPFLMLQRDTLLKQLSTNDNEMKSALDELEEFDESPEGTYESFIKSLRSARTSSPPPVSSSSGSMSQPQKPGTLALHSSPASQITSPSSPSITSPCSDINNTRPVIHPPQARPIPGMDKLGLYPLPVPSSNDSHLHTDPKHAGSSRPQTDITSDTLEHHQPVPPSIGHSATASKKEIFDFVPDELPELSSFLDDAMSPRSPDTNYQHRRDSSSDEDLSIQPQEDQTDGPRKSKRSNPMVAVFQDDIDEDDVSRVSTIYNGLNNHSEATSSDDDDRNDHYVLPAMAATKRSLNGANPSVNVTVTSLPDRITPVKTVTKEEISVPEYSQISFDATDLDILDQISSRKEPDTDQSTINSASSVKKEKKSKKHHKHSEMTKESGGKKKKKKSSRKSDDDTVKESVNHSKQSKEKHLKSVISDCPVQIVQDESSDSLEKFLNE